MLDTFALVEGTCASTANGVVSCNYPSGFNANNSMVVSAGFCHNSEWYYNTIVSTTPRVVLGSVIKVQNDTVNEVWYNKPFRVLLKKIS